MAMLRAMRIPFFTILIGCVIVGCTAHAADAALRDKAAQALRRACEYFDTHVSTEGGYLWDYSEDLKHRAGEGIAPATTVWVQPPGTPSVAMAFLRAYHATKDSYYLNLARKAGDCLRRGQLESGGWAYRIDFDPKHRQKYAYRVERTGKSSSLSNISVLDDNTTQAALRFLVLLDQTLGFKDAKVHEVVEYGLRKLMEAQYPNGAWPQRFDRAPDASKFPVKKASYPATWSRTFPAVKYYDYYTFNDNAMADAIALMFLAGKVYQQPKYRESAEKCGQFILLAQMPDPQPAWAQQYNADMQPAWARKFEPPSITGGESQGILQILMHIYQETGNRKYLEPIPRAVEYLKKSAMPDGRLARFYELQTNKPLYFTKDYQLSYDDSDMPTHYSFKQDSRLERVEAQYKRLLQTDVSRLRPERAENEWKASRPKPSEVTKVIAALDSQGRWLSPNQAKEKRRLPSDKLISCATFIRNVNVLSNYLAP